MLVKTTAVLLLLALAGSVGGCAPNATEREIETRKALLAERLKSHNVEYPPAMLCTGRAVSDSTVKIFYELAFLGEAKISQSESDKALDDVVNTYVKTCHGNPDEMTHIIAEKGSQAVFKTFAGMMVLADR